MSTYTLANLQDMEAQMELLDQENAVSTRPPTSIMEESATAPTSYVIPPIAIEERCCNYCWTGGFDCRMVVCLHYFCSGPKEQFEAFVQKYLSSAGDRLDSVGKKIDSASARAGKILDSGTNAMYETYQSKNKEEGNLHNGVTATEEPTRNGSNPSGSIRRRTINSSIATAPSPTMIHAPILPGIQEPHVVPIITNEYTETEITNDSETANTVVNTTNSIESTTIGVVGEDEILDNHDFGNDDYYDQEDENTGLNQSFDSYDDESDSSQETIPVPQCLTTEQVLTHPWEVVGGKGPSYVQTTRHKCLVCNYVEKQKKKLDKTYKMRTDIKTSQVCSGCVHKDSNTLQWIPVCRNCHRFHWNHATNSMILHCTDTCRTNGCKLFK